MQLQRKFSVDRTNGKVMGVSAGMANYFGVDAIWIRLAWVLGTVFGFGSVALVYLIIGLVAD